MTNGVKLIWRGDRRCRCLSVITPSGYKDYLDGYEIPAGTLDATREAAMIADGMIERIGSAAPPSVAEPLTHVFELVRHDPVVPLPTLAATNPAPPVQIAVVHGEPHPLSIAMLGAPAALEALTDSADLLDLLPLEQPETDLPMPAEPLPVPHNPAADMKPDTAPVRARKSASDDDGRHKRKKGKR